MSPHLLRISTACGGRARATARRLSTVRLLLHRSRIGVVDDGRVIGGLVALALRRDQENRAVPVWLGAPADPDGHDDPLPLDRGLALLVFGMMVLWLSTRFRTRLILAGLLIIGPVYATVRVTNLWSGQQAVDLAEAFVGPERAQSLEYRFMCEDLLITRPLSSRSSDGAGGVQRSLLRCQ